MLTDWGWMREGERLILISTNLPVAPDSIVNVVRCGCKMRCSSALCTCRKNGLNCMTACHCHGRECENMDQLKNCGVGVDLSVDGGDEALLDIVYDDDVDWVYEEIVV